MTALAGIEAVFPRDRLIGASNPVANFASNSLETDTFGVELLHVDRKLRTFLTQNFVLLAKIPSVKITVSFGEFPTDLLCSRFHDHIERRFRGTAEPRKSALRENVSQASLAGLRSKGEADFLTERAMRG
jgi:hypothetical protein